MTRAFPYLMAAISVGCSSLEPPPDDDLLLQVRRDSLDARVSIADEEPIPFVADEVMANVGTLGDRQELVISGISTDRTRSLAFVLELNLLPESGIIHLSDHAAMYLEMGLSGTDFVFDGPPQGELRLDKPISAGRDLSGSFDVTIPTLDADGLVSSNFWVHLTGSLSVGLEGQTN